MNVIYLMGAKYSYELPDYGELNFRRDISIVLKYIELSQNNDDNDEYKKSSYQKYINNALRSIPPSYRNNCEFIIVANKLRIIGYTIPNPIKYTIKTNYSQTNEFWNTYFSI